nr:helix-turn-helix domain-containing protein [uncultured Schaedlerella sp.]
MAYLKNIIQALESTFQIQIHGQYHSRTAIYGIRFFTGKNSSPSAPEENLLYIGRADAVLSGARPPHLLLPGLTAAPAHPEILYIEEDLEMTELFNCVEEVILEHSILEERRKSLFQALHNNSGISAMARVAHSFLNNPVTVCDTSFSVIAAYPVVSDTEHLEVKQGRTYVKDRLFQNMENTRIIEHIYTSTVPFITMLDEHPYKWVFESIRIHHTVVGYICVRGTVREFTEDDLEFIEAFSQMLSIEMQKDSSYRHPTGFKYEYFLTELLEGHFDRTDYILDHLIRLGRSQTHFYMVLVLKFTEASKNMLQPKSYYEQLLTILPECMVVLFRGDLVILLPGNSQTIFSEKEKNRFETFLKLNHMRAFVSSPYTDISKTSLYYRQTHELYRLCEKRPRPEGQYLVYFEDHFLEHILSQCTDIGLLAASVHPNLLRLLEYDQASGTEYARTLRLYLSNNRNAAAAAAELHIHRSTFFYRLGKMEELFGIQINSGKDLFAYECSFRILDYLGDQNTEYAVGTVGKGRQTPGIHGISR